MVDAELALGNRTEALTYLTEFEEAAEVCASAAMRAEASDRRAALALLDGDEQLAIDQLQVAINGWTGLQMPYEAAQSRLSLGGVLQSAGNDAAALMEMGSAGATLERLGMDQS